MEPDDERLLYIATRRRRRADRARGRGSAHGAAAEDAGQTGLPRPDGDPGPRYDPGAPRADVDIDEARQWRAAHRVVAAQPAARLVRHQLRRWTRSIRSGDQARRR